MSVGTCRNCCAYWGHRASIFTTSKISRLLLNLDQDPLPSPFSSESAVVRQADGTTWIFYYTFNHSIFYERKPHNGKASRHQIIIDGSGVIGSPTELSAILASDSVCEVFYPYLHDLIFCFPHISFFFSSLFSRINYCMTGIVILPFFDLLVANESILGRPYQPRVYYIDKNLILREAALSGTTGNNWLKGNLSNLDWKVSQKSILASLGTTELQGPGGDGIRVYFNEPSNPTQVTVASTTSGRWEKAPF